MEKQSTLSPGFYKMLAKIGVVALLLLIVPVSCRMFAASPDNNKNLAYVVARNAVRRQLKAPSTAIFPHSYDQGVSVTRLEDNSFAISSFVDAQNSFGAQVRQRWVANVRGDNYKNMTVVTARVLD